MSTVSIGAGLPDGISNPKKVSLEIKGIKKGGGPWAIINKC